MARKGLCQDLTKSENMSKSLVSGHLTPKLPLSNAEIILLNCQAGCVLYLLRVGAYLSQNIRVPVARKPWALGVPLSLISPFIHLRWMVMTLVIRYHKLYRPICL